MCVFKISNVQIYIIVYFSREYNEILRYSADGVSATSEHSQHPDNKHKNR